VGGLDHAHKRGEHDHDHEPVHERGEHGHDHGVHDARAEVPRSNDDTCSTAVLDIGKETGALVIYADVSMVGEEIEICPDGVLALKSHNVVRARQTPNGIVHAAVFPALVEGSYSILDRSFIPTRVVEIIGARVSEIDCRSVVYA